MLVRKRCNYVSCRELIDRSESYCEEHKGIVDKEYNDYRNQEQSEYIAFYKSMAWRKKREQALRRDKWLCQHCLKEGIYQTADLVDHILETKDYWKKRLDLDNLQSLCTTHHNIKTAEEDRKRKGK